MSRNKVNVEKIILGLAFMGVMWWAFTMASVRVGDWLFPYFWTLICITPWADLLALSVIGVGVWLLAVVLILLALATSE